MIKVLHIIRSLNAGGIGAFLMNVYRHLDRERYQFDFAVTSGGMGEYGKEIIESGGNIFFISDNYNEHISDGLSQLLTCYKLMRKEKYDIVHSHYYFANAYFLLIAKIAGVPKRISHCHNTRTKKVGIIRKCFENISRKILFMSGTDFLGCSESAAEFLYGINALNANNVSVLYNGIDYEAWDENKYDKEEIRKKYNLQDKHIYIFVGRFEEQKNPIYALRVFADIRKRVSDSIFLMVGYGSYFNLINEEIARLGIKEEVRLLPANSDIPALQSVAEVMIAPSLWEGLSVAFIEAQKMKTMVFTSDKIPQEINMGWCQFTSLTDINLWGEKILEYIKGKSALYEYNYSRYVAFNIKNTVKELLKVYGV